MGQTAFSLAGVSLYATPDYTQSNGGFEVPQDLETGLETWGSTHRIPQTSSAQPKIITQTFGVFPKPITWTAYFLGTNALSRYRTLAAAHQAQKVVPFIYGAERWDVVIWDLKKKSRSRYDIEYTIELRPLLERSGTLPNASPSVAASTNLTTQYTNLTNSSTSVPQINGAADPRALAANTSLLSSLTAIQAAQPEQSQTIPTLLGLTTTVNATLAAAIALQAALVNSAAQQDIPTYMWATSLIAYLESYLNTLGSFTGTQMAVTVTSNGGDCFSIAAAQLGDWTRFSDLLQINNITDPFLTGAVTLTIPQN